MLEHTIATIGDLINWLAQYGEDSELLTVEVEIAQGEPDDTFGVRTRVRYDA